MKYSPQYGSSSKKKTLDLTFLVLQSIESFHPTNPDIMRDIVAGLKKLLRATDVIIYLL